MSIFKKPTSNVETSELEIKDDEWIWVTGYKGTDKDMCCRGYQYEFGKQFDMDENAKIKECKSGFHMCLKLTDVYDFYKVENNNRFFEVRALVRADDVAKYGFCSSYSMYFPVVNTSNKLAAKSIEFIRELSVDEILKGSNAENWSEEDKKLALSVGIEKAGELRHKNTLLEMGYSEAFTIYLINHSKTAIALAVGSQPNLSMDMKVWAIMKD